MQYPVDLSDSLYISRHPTASLCYLPAEIQIQIHEYLTYPDLLALRLSSRYFYDTLETTIERRVDWLLKRKACKLPVPEYSSCRFGSDQDFCSNPEVARILRRRWLHLDCSYNGGCCHIVLEGGRCPGQQLVIRPQSTISCQLRCAISSGISGLFIRLYNVLPSSTNICFAALGALNTVLLSYANSSTMASN